MNQKLWKWTRAGFLLLVSFLLAFNASSLAQYGDTDNFNTSSSANVGDPVSAGSGAYHFRMPLFSLGGPMNLGFDLIYGSHFFSRAGGFPNNFLWWPMTTAGIAFDRDGVVFSQFTLPNSDVVAFKQVGGDWVLVGPDDGSLGSSTGFVFKQANGHAYLMDPIQERVYVYEDFVIPSLYRIKLIVDRNGNQLMYTYAGNDRTNINPHRIQDGLGRSLDLSYDKEGFGGHLERVTDQGGRQVSFTL